MKKKKNGLILLPSNLGCQAQENIRTPSAPSGTAIVLLLSTGPRISGLRFSDIPTCKPSYIRLD